MQDNTSENKRTQYRIITIIPGFFGIHDRFLQFKSTKLKRNFPDVWNTHVVNVWRYIPEETNYVHRYLDEKCCPTSLPFFEDVKCSFYEHEDFRLIPFVEEFPDIREYFKSTNKQRDEYLRKENEARNAKTVYL